MNKGQHNTFKKLSPDFFSIETYALTIAVNYIILNHIEIKSK